MPSFELLAPRHEPDLGAYLGISLEGVRTYPDLLAAIRQKRPGYGGGSLCNPIANPFRSKLSRAQFGNMYTLAFDLKGGAFARYHVLLDHEGNILCIENFFGYSNPSPMPAYLLFRVVPVVAFGVLVFLAFKFFLPA